MYSAFLVSDDHDIINVQQQNKILFCNVTQSAQHHNTIFTHVPVYPTEMLGYT